MFSRLMGFINHSNILFHKQFGFRQHHSTLQAVLSIADKIQTSIDSSSFSCGIFLDLSKAFDTVNHKILLDKLSFYRIRGNVLEWFKSYLSNRKQFVSIGNVNSDVMSITMGVPQSSLFLFITRAEGTELRFRLCSLCCFYFSGRGLYVLGIRKMIWICSF